MNDSQIEQRKYQLARSHGICEVCYRPLAEGEMQGAHRIGQTVEMYSRFGKEIIDHPLNIGIVCSLGCNQKLDISKNPVEIWKLVKEIADYELSRK